MTEPKRQNDGIKQLINKHRKAFRIPENLNHYSDKDLLVAEKKYVKHALATGKSSAAGKN